MVDLLGFFEHANKLKFTERSGWVSKVNVKEPESVADHSYLTSLMCMVIADMKGLDTDKTLRMALLHDLAESLTGDLMPEEVSKEKKNEMETRTMEAILNKLPPDLHTRYDRLWREYRNMSSEEAILVHQIDKLEMALQASDYLKKGYDLKLLEQFFLSAEEGVSDKELQELLNSLKRVKT